MARTIDAAAIGRSAAAMVARGAAIAEHLQKVNPLRFGQFIRRVELAVRCLRDVVRGDYRLPWKTVAALAAALAYFLSPRILRVARPRSDQLLLAGGAPPLISG